MRFLKTLLIVLAFAAALLFCLQNSAVLEQTLSFRFDTYINGIIWEAPAIPLAAVVVMAFLLGAFFAILFLMFDRVRLSSNLRKIRKSNRQLLQEVTSLRKIPLTGQAADNAETK